MDGIDWDAAVSERIRSGSWRVETVACDPDLGVVVAIRNEFGEVIATGGASPR